MHPEFCTACHLSTLSRQCLFFVIASANDLIRFTPYAGHVAAATSTGGITYKRVGRVGDSPLIGCGALADDASGAVSTTGHGESIARVQLAQRAALLLEQGVMCVCLCYTCVSDKHLLRPQEWSRPKPVVRHWII